MKFLKDIPKISIVTPSYNQGDFIEETILSVLEQNYPNLEYIIIDGGSKDKSVEIIKRYEKHLAYWVSEADRGQYHAINKGFTESTGEVMAWLNSDDKYCPWTLKVVADIFMQNEGINWITSLFPMIWNDIGLGVACFKRIGYAREAFFEGRYTDFSRSGPLYYIQQESTFWKRSLWDMSGSKLAEDVKLAADFDLWARFFKHANLYGVSVPLGGFRTHLNQRSRQIEDYRQECNAILQRYMSPNLTMLRYLVRAMQLNKMPLIGAAIDRAIGYDLYQIDCNYQNCSSAWLPKKTRKLF